ncbi:DNA polymerase IV [Patescibacteria group bacterium]|nr:DNA polymerase IV [Patescibacteria group bacterium]
MQLKRIILHLDMDSFFATVEQQANPFLRGKPIVVSGKEGSRSVIVASSREAKKWGIKTAMLPREAKKLCPTLIFVEPDGVKYEYLSRKFIEILKLYTDKVQVFSIDEAFLDLTGFVADFNGAREIALEIKRKYKNELGDWISCSVGIAGNKLLAKLASDLEKPDGLVIIDEKNKEQILDKIKLTDFCGIGRQLEKRLDALGINSVSKLKDYPLHNLINEFGNVAGHRLHDMSFGIDFDPVVSYLNEYEPKSVSRAYTLPRNTWEIEEILAVLMHLCEKAGRELRRKKLSAKTLIFYLRYADFSHGGARKTLPRYVNDSFEIYQIGECLLKKINLKKPVRLIGLWLTNLSPSSQQIPLWREERKKQKLIPFLDKINDIYGELTIKPAFLLKLKRLRKKVGGFKVKD